MNQTESIADLTASLVKAQGEIEGAAKKAENPHFRSKYADLGSVWDACRGPLTNNGLAVVQMPRYFENEMRLVTRIVHSSGQWMEDDGFPLLLGKQDMQGLGSATTYARRYGLMAAVGIAPEDDDGNAAVSNSEGKKVQSSGRQNGNGNNAPKAGDKDSATAWTNNYIGQLPDCQNESDIDALGVKYAKNLSGIEKNRADLNALITDAVAERREAIKKFNDDLDAQAETEAA